MLNVVVTKITMKSSHLIKKLCVVMYFTCTHTQILLDTFFLSLGEDAFCAVACAHSFKISRGGCAQIQDQTFSYI